MSKLKEVGPSSNQEAERARMSKTSAFLWQTRHGDVSTVRSLLQLDSSLVSCHDYDGRTPLHVAAFYNCIPVATLLLRHGAPVNAQDRWGNSPLADAQAKGHLEMEKLLRENGGRLLGNHGSPMGAKATIPPLPQRCDWELDPSELDFSNGMLVGKGSFGEIWKATWRGTPVAVKKILPSISHDDIIMCDTKDFKKEVEILVKLRHPNVVQFLGAVTTKPLMLVMEYLGAGDLHGFLKENGALSAITALKFAKDIAQGMVYLHNGANCIIHRDLKPKNLLLLENNDVKVADFGLSKIFRLKHAEYNTSGETGTYRYMAPEVFDHKLYGPKVDVFSFAMIMFEMFEGVPPLCSMSSHDAAKKMAKENLRPKMCAKTYPPNMKKLITTCWSADPNERPTFKDILQYLEAMELEMSQTENRFWPF